jgi:hypothetical protein
MRAHSDYTDHPKTDHCRRSLPPPLSLTPPALSLLFVLQLSAHRGGAGIEVTHRSPDGSQLDHVRHLPEVAPAAWGAAGRECHFDLPSGGSRRPLPPSALPATTPAWRGPAWLIRGMRSGLGRHTMGFEGMSSGPT